MAGPTCESLRPIRSIVLATDLTEQTWHSAQYASCLAQDHGARLTVMHVLPQAATIDEQDQAELSTHRSLHQFMPDDCEDRCTLKYEVKTGEIAPVILHSAQANKANLIVLGARHGKPLADHIPRTKPSAIIRGSHCPVLVVPAH